jgi:hypothetical protein
LRVVEGKQVLLHQGNNRKPHDSAGVEFRGQGNRIRTEDALHAE